MHMSPGSKPPGEGRKKNAETQMNLEALKAYLVDLFEGRPGESHPRIEHTRLHDTVLAIVGGLVMHAESVDLPGQQDHYANVVQFTIAGHQYCLCRRTATKLIEVRESLRSPALYVFDGSRPVCRIFAELAGRRGRINSAA
jgi:hypothetical protein